MSNLVYNLSMGAGLIAICTGAFMAFGTPIALMMSGTIVILLTLVAALPIWRKS